MPGPAVYSLRFVEQSAMFSLTFSHERLFVFLVVGLTLSLLAEGCTRTISRKEEPPLAAAASVPARPRTVQIGRASWYGQAHQGKMTASGEVYNQYDLTAAHPSLPLGSRAVVTNLDNGKTVEVRINDRGPFVKGRVIDLSRGAAQTIGLLKPGTARVRVKTLSPRKLGGTRYRKSRRQRIITKRKCDSCESQW